MFWNKKHFRNLTIDEIRGKARVLFIDDQDRRDIIDYLGKSGWQCRQLLEKDFESLDSIDIKDSHILCVDINGVGEKLGKTNGLDIVESIKTKMPEKKVIIYSSQPTQNIFHNAVNLADRKILKSAGDYEIFLNSIEELSKQVFDWNEILRSSFDSVKPCWPDNLTFEKYKRLLEKTCSSENLTPEQLTSALKISFELGSLIYRGVKLFL